MALTERKSGVLLPISALPSDYGIGDLGPDAVRFASLLRQSGQTYWQILPLNPVSRTKAYSPYACNSAFAGNVLLVSPEGLYESGLISKGQIEEETAFFSNDTFSQKVDYRQVSVRKAALLEKAYERFFSQKTAAWEDFEHFCDQHDKDWLEGFSFFKVLKDIHKESSWRTWPQSFREGDPGSFGAEIREMAQKEKFFQYLFFIQWTALKEECSRLGIKIIGDIPIYVDYESADVWTNIHIFKLDRDLKPLFVAGVPPDYFSETGQLWENPVYHWVRLKERGYRWWVQRIRHNLWMVDMVRIDHFRGLVAYWEVGAGEKNAINGRWVEAEAEDFFRVLTKELMTDGQDLPIIAEDLGHITDDVIDIIRRHRFPGTRVVLFAFGDDFPHSIHLPANYEKNCVAYTGTHDNNTVIGFFRQDASLAEKANLAHYLKKEIYSKTLPLDLIRTLFLSPAALCMIPVQDILGLGPEARMNRPSTAKGNWVWRMPKKDMDPQRFEGIAALSKDYGRI